MTLTPDVTDVLKGRMGEFHPHWKKAVQEAERRLSEESDGPLRQLYAWKLKVTRGDLQYEKERLEEEGYGLTLEEEE